jgi:hypothetical protein
LDPDERLEGGACRGPVDGLSEHVPAAGGLVVDEAVVGVCERQLFA